MRFVVALFFSAVASLVGYAAGVQMPVRAVLIVEASAPAGTSKSNYTACTEDITAEFSTTIDSAATECDDKTAYKWTSPKIPTDAQRLELCTCTDLIAVLQTVTVPRCNLEKGNSTYSLAAWFEYWFKLCDGNGGVTPTAAPTARGGETVATTSSLPLILGVIGGAIVAVLIVVAAFRCGHNRNQNAVRKRSNPGRATRAAGAFVAIPVTPSVADERHGKRSSVASKQTTESTGSSFVGMRGVSESGGLWDDRIIVNSRVCYEDIVFGPLLSCGSYGEVYKGTYKGNTIAIKRLIPVRRTNMAHINQFLQEVKLWASLHHRSIVQFIGVAWDESSHLCVVVEYMDNGDLRSALIRWEQEQHRPHGFDADKVKIALNVAEALSYLHSLAPTIVHRDLKSKNIVLNANYDAKLTDFGVSRERPDATMTAKMGTLLWMAPEVLLGDRYDEKADVFSFGVVLSELDTQQLPYFQAGNVSVMQLVLKGQLTVEFTDGAHPDLVQLGRECVSLDPEERPSTSDVLRRVHQGLLVEKRHDKSEKLLNDHEERHDKSDDRHDKSDDRYDKSEKTHRDRSRDQAGADCPSIDYDSIDWNGGD